MGLACALLELTPCQRDTECLSVGYAPCWVIMQRGTIWAIGPPFIYIFLVGGKTHGYGRTFRFAQELSVIIIAYAKIESLQSLIHV